MQVNLVVYTLLSKLSFFFKFHFLFLFHSQMSSHWWLLFLFIPKIKPTWFSIFTPILTKIFCLLQTLSMLKNLLAMCRWVQGHCRLTTSNGFNPTTLALRQIPSFWVKSNSTIIPLPPSLSQKDKALLIPFVLASQHASDGSSEFPTHFGKDAFLAKHLSKWVSAGYQN